MYPNNFWKVKLIDDRIREFWYRRTPSRLIHLHYLPERALEVMEHIGGTLPEDHYIAGGAALYIAGITDRYTDIDIFTCNREASEAWIRTLKQECSYTGAAMSYKNKNMEIQLILKEYSSPSHIIHGFDLSSCSVIFDPRENSVKTTYKGAYCIDRKVNWFEPERYSPSYALRLAKYHMRGFKIRLPMTDGLYVRIGNLEEKVRSVALEHTEYKTRMDKTCDIMVNNYAASRLRRECIKMTELVKHMLSVNGDIEKNKFYLRWPRSYDKTDTELSKKIVEDSCNVLNLMSIIVLACHYNIPPSLLRKRDNDHTSISDYANTKDGWKQYDSTCWGLTGTSQMYQTLLGTFNPEPIDDVLEFYLSSPLVFKSENDDHYINL
jgi:hypothetical protein